MKQLCEYLLSKKNPDCGLKFPENPDNDTVAEFLEYKGFKEIKATDGYSAFTAIKNCEGTSYPIFNRCFSKVLKTEYIGFFKGCKITEDNPVFMFVWPKNDYISHQFYTEWPRGNDSRGTNFQDFGSYDEFRKAAITFFGF